MWTTTGKFSQSGLTDKDRHTTGKSVYSKRLTAKHTQAASQARGEGHHLPGNSVDSGKLEHGLRLRDHDNAALRKLPAWHLMWPPPQTAQVMHYLTVTTLPAVFWVMSALFERHTFIAQ